MNVARKWLDGLDATSVWETPAMTDKDDAMDKVRAAVKKLGRATKAIDGARDELGQAIAAALIAGVRPTDLEPEVPYNREHIRRLARAHGAPPLRESTVVSRRKAEEGQEP
jgi:hypothetical protein